MKKITLLLTALLLTGCSISPRHSYAYSAQPFTINQHEKRLNTADCKDLDDWYLDGFRVGKTHRAAGKSLLTQRIHYCESQTTVSNQMKATWNEGFGKSQPRQNIKKRKRT